MIEIVGWLGTLAVILGYWLNANGKLFPALVIWIVGDLIWIAYDLYREIFPHLGLCAFIIVINSYGIFKIKKEKHGKSSNECRHQSSR